MDFKENPRNYIDDINTFNGDSVYYGLCDCIPGEDTDEGSAFNKEPILYYRLQEITMNSQKNHSLQS